MILCRFCSDPAVAVYTMSQGCLCHPGDREQALCWHHVVRATPLGNMVLKEDLTEGQWFSAWQKCKTEDERDKVLATIRGK